MIQSMLSDVEAHLSDTRVSRNGGSFLSNTRVSRSHYAAATTGFVSRARTIFISERNKYLSAAYCALPIVYDKLYAIADATRNCRLSQVTIEISAGLVCTEKKVSLDLLFLFV